MTVTIFLIVIILCKSTSDNMQGVYFKMPESRPTFIPLNQVKFLLIHQFKLSEKVSQQWSNVFTVVQTQQENAYHTMHLLVPRNKSSSLC